MSSDDYNFNDKIVSVKNVNGDIELVKSSSSNISSNDDLDNANSNIINNRLTTNVDSNDLFSNNVNTMIDKVSKVNSSKPSLSFPVLSKRTRDKPRLDYKKIAMGKGKHVKTE